MFLEKLKCDTFLLDDNPSCYDELGAHERVARAIYDTISTESGGKSIAICGVFVNRKIGQKAIEF